MKFVFGRLYRLVIVFAFGAVHLWYAIAGVFGAPDYILWTLLKLIGVSWTLMVLAGWDYIAEYRGDYSEELWPDIREDEYLKKQEPEVRRKLVYLKYFERVFILVGCFLAMGVTWWMVMVEQDTLRHWTIALHGLSSHDYEFLITLPSFYVFVPSFISLLVIVGIIFSAIAWLFVYNILPLWEEYRKVYDRQNRLSRLKSVQLHVVWGICVLWVLLHIGSYAVVSPSSMVVSRFFSLGEQEYAWQEIRSIESVSAATGPMDDSGNIRYRIVFSDDTVWRFVDSSLKYFRFQEKAVKFISTRAGKPIQEAGQ